MKLKLISAEKALLVMADGTEVFFSNELPVAGFLPGSGCFQTDGQLSEIATEHVSHYLGGRTAKCVPQHIIHSFLGHVYD